MVTEIRRRCGLLFVCSVQREGIVRVLLSFLFCLQKSLNKGKPEQASSQLVILNVPDEDGKMRNSTLSDFFLAFLDSEINFTKFWGQKSDTTSI